LSAAPILRQLFDDDQVGLYVQPLGGQLPVVEPIWTDGFDSPVPFSPDDCWALRRNQTYLVDSEHPGPGCRHLGGQAVAAYMCVPILAQGRTRALLHIRQAPPEAGRRTNRGPAIGEGQQQLARTVADSMGLAFSNLELRDSLREQSIRDGLTGLYNRRYMEESLEREIFRAARHQNSVGVVMLDIDHFKAFNDAHGHLAGDVLLRELGRLLRAHIRGADIACRYGGEEFILILPEASLEVTRQRAEHLWGEARSLRPEFAGRLLDSVTVSMGVAAYPSHGTTAEAVLRAADEALYRAKHEGRDRVVAR
jgi:diguanylate cyclase (GGDEF)-like protein